MTHDEKRLYLVGQCLAGAAHRSPTMGNAVAMGTRAIEIADGVLEAMGESEAEAPRHDTIPMPARSPDDSGHWKPLPFDGEELTHSEVERPTRFDRLESEIVHGNNGNGHAASR